MANAVAAVKPRIVTDELVCLDYPLVADSGPSQGLY
jgi:hypothetical protein